MSKSTISTFQLFEMFPTLAYLTAEDKLAAAEVALLELKPYVRKFEVELKRIIKARRSAMPGFLRDAEDAL
jgi:hypothetical protein